ncbi:MAG: hypothetical protein JWR72_1954 [Flavisolibacter sp.]|nr:hypothetical protein [Flavisolibacter sp.]
MEAVTIVEGITIALISKTKMHKIPSYIVVAGASAGGLNSVIELSVQLKKEMDIAVFVVLHLSQISLPAVLVERIQKNTAFTCKIAEHGESIRAQHLYLAVPDKHLLLKGDKIILGEGTAENRWRPSIDVLFRSAAAQYDGRTVGIILSGLLQDGTAGMQAIKRCGGTVIVQEPTEAEYPDMPLSVLNNVQVDYCVPLSAMGDILLEKSRSAPTEKVEIPKDIAKEAQIAERVVTSIEGLKELGEHSLYSCPDCSGGLWEIVSGGVVRYRCHTGHVYTQNELLLKQSEALEDTLWVALRMLEERKHLLDKMAKEEGSKGWMRMATQKTERAAELEVHIDRLKDVLFHTKDNLATVAS